MKKLFNSTKTISTRTKPGSEASGATRGAAVGQGGNKGSISVVRSVQGVFKRRGRDG